jgi:methylated-DNA-protein-cysteine methyltransferase-like protein
MRRPIQIEMSPFTQKVLALIKSVPRGKVATYGQIAALAGKPHGARGVGWILNSCAKSHRLPWQRVINSKGKISFPKNSDEFKKQKALLMKEKIAVDRDGSVSLPVYLWRKTARKARAKKNMPRMFS